MTRHTPLILMTVGILAAALGDWIQPAYRLLYNPTTSAPRGWYVIVPPRDLAVGAFALARLPPAAASLADERRYLPRSVPLVKHIAAMGGQSVCEKSGVVRIDRVLVARALTRDSAGRVLEPWSGCRRLAEDELFLLSPGNTASFDSRYFGPVRRSALLGKAIPLRTW
jgi:conjugative transfer signal peptidase TraF